MDLFFGASTNASRARQSGSAQQQPKKRSPAEPARQSRDTLQQADRKRQRRRAEERSSERQKQPLPTSSSASLSIRDNAIVNTNRERVGSLPSSPRPQKGLTRLDRSQPRIREKLPASGTSPKSVATQETERCASVPPLMNPLNGEKSPISDFSPNDQVADDASAASLVNSADAVRQSESQYVDYFQWQSDAKRDIELHLPGADSIETFSLRMPKSFERETDLRDEYLPINDLISTVRAIALYLVESPEFKRVVYEDNENGIMRQLERARNRRNGDDFVHAVYEFNRLLDQERANGDVRPVFSKNQVPSDLAIHIVEQTYNRIVAPTVDMLRQYKAFSNNVYGEILPTLISEFIEHAKITADSTFIDLGCGIGNVVLQVAAQTGCYACGIEIMKVPAKLAKRQAQEFAKRMQLYNMGHSPVRIWHGDFCESTDVQRLLPQADVVLVNNYAFDSKLNQNLLQMFLDLKEGTRIISLKPFVTPDHKISARNIYSPESILTVRRYQYWSQCVSWTDSGGEYFVQTVDRSRMKKFLARHGMM
ncbi:Nucleosomal histone H3-Lys79 methylase [Coemansia sp. RSA 1290]|nr:Nucleosomal histone H3-Lys79 methylase [Coemansia sp. RSA 1086]KAJ2633448.1 Nucleosomal histone H3-Lys79 methylase [Coemansia sp. RSA 1290]KAJ2646802.1 Nucleosomal histone H3-Lys79 methylase [Coemansia sp. RSA 1250]